MIHQNTISSEFANRGSVSSGVRSCDDFDTLLSTVFDLSKRNRISLQSIGITSCLHGEGVSTVSAQLAIRAARSLAAPVLLIETDTAHPTFERMFEVGKSPGLLGILSDEAALSECVLPSPVENLSILGAGAQGNASGVFSPRSVAKTLEDLREQYSLVIVDLPPINEPGPCLTIAGQLDGVLLTVEAERVSSRMTQRARRQLAQVGAHLLGVVLNKRYEHLPHWLCRNK